LYFLLKEDYSIDVAKIISNEIHKFVTLEVNKNNQKAKGFLGFLALIIALYQTHRIKVNPTVKITLQLAGDSQSKIVQMQMKILMLATLNNITLQYRLHNLLSIKLFPHHTLP